MHIAQRDRNEASCLSATLDLHRSCISSRDPRFSLDLNGNLRFFSGGLQAIEDNRIDIRSTRDDRTLTAGELAVLRRVDARIIRSMRDIERDRDIGVNPIGRGGCLLYTSDAADE